MRAVLARQLRVAGFEMLEAADGAAALRLLAGAELLPDAVLMENALRHLPGGGDVRAARSCPHLQRAHARRMRPPGPPAAPRDGRQRRSRVVLESNAGKAPAALRPGGGGSASPDA